MKIRVRPLGVRSPVIRKISLRRFFGSLFGNPTPLPVGKEGAPRGESVREGRAEIIQHPRFGPIIVKWPVAGQ